MVKNNEKIIILGASGFLGSAISQFFFNQGFTVIGVDIVNPNRRENYSQFYKITSIEKELNSILTEHQADLLINLIGNVNIAGSLINPRSDFHSSANLFSFILDQIRSLSKDTKVIFLSSAAVYGQPKTLPISETANCLPLSPYGYHKRLCELIAEEYALIYGIKTVSLRVFSAYGNGLKRQILWDLCNKCSSSELVELSGDGNESRDFIHSEDISKAILCIYKQADFLGEFYNVASGKETTILELAHQILFEFGKNKNYLKFNQIDRSGDPKNWHADIRRIKSFGFSTGVNLSDGLSEYINWFKNNANRN